MSQVSIVRKTLQKVSNGISVEWEEECLQILDHLRHPNIVPLFASYSYRGYHHFLFPLLPMNLEHFLQLPERFGEFKNDLTFCTALQGISSALETVHSLNLNARDHDMELGRIGYHHDLKPANVLVDSRTFYLADFGLSKLKPEEKGSRTQWKAGLGDYVAPECLDEHLRHQNVGRPLDIWSFGCMVSEIAAYIDGGPDGVQRFRNHRLGSAYRENMTDHYFFTGHSLRPQVTSWLKTVKRKSQNRVLSNLLDAADMMLKIDPIERPNAVNVQQQFSFLSVAALFNAVEHNLYRYLGAASNQGGGTSLVTTIHNEIARLAAWGKVLQLTGYSVSADAIEIASSRYNHFYHILTKIREGSDPDKNADETVPPSAVAYSICKPFHQELQGLIDKMWRSLPTVQREKVKQVWLVDSLDRRPEGLHDIESGKLSSQYSELGVMASTKQEILRLTNHDSKDAELAISKQKDLRLNSDALQIESNFSEGLSIGRYDDKQVFVERVSPAANRDDMSELRREQRMQLTAEVFSNLNAFHVLECLGFTIPSSGVSGHYGYVFVWAFPASTPRQAMQPREIVPMSLFDVLNSRKKNELPLGERFQLAYKLVNCIEKLHIVGWLHKNINSRNVVFFVEERSTTTVANIFLNPYMINFRYSRSSTEVCQTERPDIGLALQHYQHPDYSPSEDYRETFDYYSVGILLLELGSWTTLDIYLSHNRALKSNPSAFRHELINKYAPRLDSIMGATYRDVTLACLLGDFGENLGSEGVKTVLEDFQDKVVDPLRKLVTSCI